MPPALTFGKLRGGLHCGYGLPTPGVDVARKSDVVVLLLDRRQLGDYQQSIVRHLRATEREFVNPPLEPAQSHLLACFTNPIEACDLTVICLILSPVSTTMFPEGSRVSTVVNAPFTVRSPVRHGRTYLYQAPTGTVSSLVLP